MSAGGAANSAPRVLVACASAHGSTRGIAERIADRLRERGGDVALHDIIADGTAPAEFGAAVIGSAVHNARWLPEATQFLRRNRETLAQRPLWLFSVSSLGDEESFFPPRVARFMRRSRKSVEESAGIPAEVPFREHRNFAGAIARDHYPLVGNLFMMAMRGRYGDHRNWPAVDGWAAAIADELAGSEQHYSI
jgi:menaquinone-dependent protoporphyrinogen oxidase